MHELHALLASDLIPLELAERRRQGARQRLVHLARAISRPERRDVAGPGLAEPPFNRRAVIEGAAR